MNIFKMKPKLPTNSYKGGAEDFSGFIRLSSNENNFGPSPKALAAIRKNTKFSNVYPELDGQSLINQISKFNKINSNQIILGAGSDEVLQMIFAAFTSPKDQVVYTRYAFAMYAIYARNFKCSPKIFNDNKFQFSLKELLKLVSPKTKLILLANPNNPTGSIFFEKELIDFLNKINKKTIVVLDGAYIEYIDDKRFNGGISLVKKYPNLIVTRSFSKIFALGGMRVGWGYSSLENITKLYAHKKPFNVSRLSIEAASATLNDQKWLERCAKSNEFVKKYTLSNIKNRSCQAIDTMANFILLKFDKKSDAQRFVDYLYKNKITVRSLASYGLPDYIRMTIGTKLDMTKTVKIINKFNV